MKKNGAVFIAAAVYAGCVTAETVTNNLDMQRGFIWNHGIIKPGSLAANGTFTSPGIRDVTISAGQLSGVDPENGAVITNAADLLQLKVQSLTAVSNIVAGGSFIGNGAGLTNLHISSLSGVISAASLPTSGIWNAAGMTISNVTYKGNGAGITNIPSSSVKNSGNQTGLGAFALGGTGNTAGGMYAVIAGGTYNYASSRSFVGGGTYNTSAVSYCVIGGGYKNTIKGDYSFIGGGNQNVVTGYYATLAGGYLNSGNGSFAAIGGGYLNKAGHCGVVPGGFFNEALGECSLAAGRQAKALHKGVFIWGDNQTNDFVSVTNDEFAVRAASGLRLVCGSFIGNGSGLYIPPQGDLSMGSFTNGLPQ